MDLENCGAKVATLNSILEKVKIRGDILLGKVYGYTDRFSDLNGDPSEQHLYGGALPALRHFPKEQRGHPAGYRRPGVAYKNELIDSFCIVSGDSDYTPLVGRLKAMGKFVLGISRSEAASTIFINACNEFQFLESVGGRKVTAPTTKRSRRPPPRRAWTRPS